MINNLYHQPVLLGFRHGISFFNFYLGLDEHTYYYIETEILKIYE